jgi:thioredoxin reductase (NADPH)
MPPQRDLCIIGERNSPLAYDLRDFLYRSGVRYEWLEGSPEDFARLSIRAQKPAGSSLVCVFPDDSLIHSPSVRELAAKLGFIHKPRYEEYDLTIFGAGPAGLSAAVYAASEGLKTVLVEKSAVGGQATTSSSIENYLGFPEGISGADLADRARRQAVKMGADILLVSEGTGARIQDGRIHARLDDGTELISKAGVCATGVTYRKLGLPNEDRYYGAGVFYGAGAGEARFLKNEDVVVVGGGNSAGQASLHFARHARRVTMLVRASSLAATISDYLVARIQGNPAIDVRLNSSVIDLAGAKSLERITVEEAGRAGRSSSCRWLFVCIGGTPNNAWSQKTRLVRDEAGYFVTGADLHRYGDPIPHWAREREPYYLETNVAGVFAIGDVRHNSVKRIASAIGEGAVVSSFVQRFLAEPQQLPR